MKQNNLNLAEVLNRLKEGGLCLKWNECSFLARDVIYLGYKVDAEGLYEVTDKVKAIQDAPALRNISELKAHLSLLNYYSKFLTNLSTLPNASVYLP